MQSMLSTADTDDATQQDMDVGQDQFQFNVSWFLSPRVNISLMLPQWIRDESKHINVTTDTVATSLLLNTWPIKEKLSFDLSQSYTSLEASDHSRDETNLTASARLAYSLKRYFPEYVKPSLSLSGEYSRTQDDINHLDQKQYRVMLTVELNANRSY